MLPETELAIRLLLAQCFAAVGLVFGVDWERIRRDLPPSPWSRDRLEERLGQHAQRVGNPFEDGQIDPLSLPILHVADRGAPHIGRGGEVVLSPTLRVAKLANLEP